MPENPTLWSKTKTNSKAGFDKAWATLDKLGAPVNRLSNKLGSEAFWPTTLDKESDKAARILQSFCKDGFYAKEDAVQNNTAFTPEGQPKGKQRVLKKIPKEVIQNAKGLAVFTVMRTGLWVSGAGGSGILVARLPDGSWSPPSGILLHTAGLGFLLGVDIYDCVVVINNEQALEAFTKVRCTLGGEVTAVAGPVGVGAVMETEVHKRQAPIFTYLKSRGFYAGVQVDGTIIIERFDENERFYNEKLPAIDILRGKVRHPPREIKLLMNTIRAAEGYEVEDFLLPHEPPPGDYEIEETPDGTHVFGIPDKEDPDPFGVLALQEQGLEIREAGTREKPPIEEFEFRPSPSSPVQNVYRRESRDIMSSIGSRRSSTDTRRNTWRASTLSNSSRMTDTATQTDADDADPHSPQSSSFSNGVPRSPAGSAHYRPSMDGVPEFKPSPRLGPPPPLPPRNKSSASSLPIAPQPESPPAMQAVTPEPIASPKLEPIHSTEKDMNNTDPDLNIDDDEDDAIIQTATTPLSGPSSATPLSKPRLVTVHKVAPPKLPARNPVRDQKRLGGEDDNSTSPVSAVSKSSFEVAPEKPNGPGELSSEAESAPTAESLSSVEVHEAKKGDEKKQTEREDDGFQEVSLNTVEPEHKQEIEPEHKTEVEAEHKKEVEPEHNKEAELSTPTTPMKNSIEAKRDSGAMRMFAQGMKMDDDDDDEPTKRAPGAF